MWLIAPMQGQETLLRWNNGDVLSGTLLESESGQIRWSSPIFADDLVVDMNALDAIEFPAQVVHANEAFRVGTVTGDVFVADLIDSTDEGLLFSSRRHGTFQVRRDVIYSLQHAANPNLVFEGSQFGQWKLLNDGPIKNLRTKVFQGDWTWGTPFPDLAELTPVDEARFTAGYLDLGLSRFREKFALSFEGDFVVSSTGKYRFEGGVDDEAHLWIDGKEIPNEAAIAFQYRSSVHLAQGSHSLRLDYIDLGGESRLSFWIVNDKEKYTSLAENNQTSGWHRGVGGHPQTFRKKASLFRAVELSDSFEIDLALSCSKVPQFALAIGKEKGRDDTSHSLRLETWADELVVVQDKVFEPVMTLEKHMRDVRLRLAFDSDTNTLKMFDAGGGLLVTVKGVQAQTGLSGITLRNRGEDLAVRRLSVYRQLNTEVRPAFDAARTRVHLVDGQVVYGRLHAAEGGAYVADQAGTRRTVELDQVDHIARPGAALAVTANVTELSYADGAIVRGRVARMSADQLLLHTAFSDEPVICALGGAALLRFGSHDTETFTSSDDMDELFTAAGRLRGRLSFDLAGSPLSWQMPGANTPLRLASGDAARIVRIGQSMPKGPSSDANQFPCVLHLKNGEIIPCQVLSYDQRTLGFESPFITQRTLDAQYVKAIEFVPLKGRKVDVPMSKQTNAFLKSLLRPEKQTLLGVDPVKLKRALTVPRFSRNSPPSHILVARNGDLKRGRLQGLSVQTIQFESKLRKQTVPVDRIARVVNVTRPEQEPNASPEALIDSSDKVRASLADGSILIFAAIESRDGELIGRSDMYGDMAIPTDRILDLSMGGFEKELFKSLFEGWVVRPAQEPDFGSGQGNE